MEALPGRVFGIACAYSVLKSYIKDELGGK
jgi:hypothetical protein